MSPDRYTHHDWPLWRRIITDLRTFLFLIVLMSLYSIVLGTAARHKAQQSIDTLVACTTAGHKCYDDQQKQAGKFLSGIQTGNVYANYCAIKLVNEPHFTPARIQ